MTDLVQLTRKADHHRLLTPGDIVWTWCSKHMDRTSHLWDGHTLICLECQPDADAKKTA